MKIRSFAKINLGIEVLGTRPDGYHDILTLFQSIDLADVLEISELPGGGIVPFGGRPRGPLGRDEPRLPGRLSPAGRDRLPPGRPDRRRQIHPGGQGPRRGKQQRGHHAPRLEPPLGARPGPGGPRPARREARGGRPLFPGRGPLPRRGPRRPADAGPGPPAFARPPCVPALFGGDGRDLRGLATVLWPGGRGVDFGGQTQ